MLFSVSNFTFLTVTEPTTDKLLLITSYVIKDEACREEKITGIETKFYALKKFDIISCCYVFRAPLRGGKMSLFAFYVTLPYSELSEFMPRYSLCEDKVRHILKKQLISKMEEKKVDVNKWMDDLDEWMDDLDEWMDDLDEWMDNLDEWMDDLDEWMDDLDEWMNDLDEWMDRWMNK